MQSSSKDNAISLFASHYLKRRDKRWEEHEVNKHLKTNKKKERKKETQIK